MFAPPRLTDLAKNQNKRTKTERKGEFYVPPMAHIKVISTDDAPKPFSGAPYSQAVSANGFVFASGQVGIVGETGKLIEGGVEAETRQTIKNLEAVLRAAGATLRDVVKSTVFLKDIDDFPAVNAVYREAFQTSCPARSAVQVSSLPLKTARVEIEVVAAINQKDA